MGHVCKGIVVTCAATEELRSFVWVYVFGFSVWVGIWVGIGFGFFLYFLALVGFYDYCCW